MISVFGSKVGEEELREVQDCFQRQWLGMGPKAKTFEEEFSRRLGLPGLALVNSGSNALYAGMVLLRLPPGSEVILPSFTWISCAHAILLAGCRPVFCDVDLATHNVTAETIARQLTPRTAAIMVVHYAGKPVRIDAIRDLGRPILEDAAHAVDSRLGGQACGGLGDVGIYSFDAVKNLVMGEGGAVTAKDPERLERARLLRYCGIGKSGFEASTHNKDRWWEYNIAEVFPKLLVSDVNAAIGLAQLRKLDQLQAVRKRIWETYQKEFADLEWLVRPADPEPDERHSYFTYVVRLPKRDASAKLLYDRGIYTTLRYHPLHLNAIFKSYAPAEPLANTEKLNQDALSLPLHPSLTSEDVAKVMAEVRDLPKRW
jgi:aminotransferase